MHSNFTEGKRQPGALRQGGMNDSASAINEGAIVCMDPTKTSGSAEAGNADITIGDDAAVAAYLTAPATTNMRWLAGVTEAALAAKGGNDRSVIWGAAFARVRNPHTAQLTLAVGTVLHAVPGADYLQPALIRSGTAPTVAIGNDVGRPAAIVRKSTTIAATTTATRVPIWVYPPIAPRHRTLHYVQSGAMAAVTRLVLDVAKSYGEIVGYGVGANANGSGTPGTDFFTADILINGTSIFTTVPKLDGDHAANFNTARSTAAAGAGTGPGTNGNYGVLDSTKVRYAPGDEIAVSLVKAASFDGTDVNLQIHMLDDA